MELLNFLFIGVFVSIALHSYKNIEIDRLAKVSHLIGVSLIGYISLSSLIGYYNLIGVEPKAIFNRNYVEIWIIPSFLNLFVYVFNFIYSLLLFAMSFMIARRNFKIVKVFKRIVWIIIFLETFEFFKLVNLDLPEMVNGKSNIFIFSLTLGINVVVWTLILFLLYNKKVRRIYDKVPETALE